MKLLLRILYFPVSFPAAAFRYSKMGIIIFGTNMYCRSNQPAGFSYGIKCSRNLVCSDKHCHKSLQIICREKSKDVRIKGSFLPFVSMQDFLFFKVVSIYISLRCILLHLCRDVMITLSVVLSGVITRTLRHRVLAVAFLTVSFCICLCQFVVLYLRPSSLHARFSKFHFSFHK